MAQSPDPPSEPDVGASADATMLQAAIQATPEDAAPQLVLADLLLSAGDPRGELIVLHHRETTEGLQDPEALERYLLLAAHFSFPHASPEEPTLPFVQVTARPAHYTLNHDGVAYELWFRNRTIELRVDDRAIYRRKLKTARRSEWSEPETAVILRHFSEAIRARTSLISVQLPYSDEALPTYEGGPVRSYRVPFEFSSSRGLRGNELGLAARDYQRWLGVWGRLFAKI